MAIHQAPIPPGAERDWTGPTGNGTSRPDLLQDGRSTDPIPAPASASVTYGQPSAVGGLRGIAFPLNPPVHSPRIVHAASRHEPLDHVRRGIVSMQAALELAE
ncbi:hypothetical protein ACFB49_32790 [Sphingomonas sp. DBB INV C78]